MYLLASSVGTSNNNNSNNNNNNNSSSSSKKRIGIDLMTSECSWVMIDNNMKVVQHITMYDNDDTSCLLKSTNITSSVVGSCHTYYH